MTDDPADDAPLHRSELIDVSDGVVAPASASATARAIDRDARLATAREQILHSMRERHTLKPPLAYALLGGGFMLMLVIGIVLSVVLKFAAYLLAGADVSATAWFIVYVIVMIGVVLWTERRARSGFFTFAGGDVDLTRDGDDDFLIERGANHVRSFIGAISWPPRAFVAGLHAVRGVPERGLDVVLPEAADTLTLMLTIDGAVKIKDLAPPATDPMQLMPVLKWLDAHDYIGIGTNGERVWVSSPAKKRFIAEGIRVPKLETKS